MPEIQPPLQPVPKLEIGTTKLYLKTPQKIGGKDVTELMVLPSDKRKTTGIESAVYVTDVPGKRAEDQGETKHKQWKNVTQGDQLNLNDEYAGIEYIDNSGKVQFIPKDQLQLDRREPQLTPASEPARPTQPAPSALKQLENRVVITGVKTKERQVYNLRNKAMERAKGWGKQAFKEVFEHKLDKYYSDLIDIAKSPFAEEAIRKAELNAEATFGKEQADRTPLRRAARNVWEGIKSITWGQTRVHELTINELTNAQNKDIQAALTRGREMYLDEKGNFAGRFDTAFDHEDLAVRKDMGENFSQAAAQPYAQEIKTLIKDYVHGDLNDKEFADKKDVLWGRIKTANPDLLKDAEDYADTLTAVGNQHKEQWRLAGNDAEGKNRINNEMDALRVALANGQMGEATSMNKTDTQKFTGKLREFYDSLVAKNIVGASLFNEATVGTAVSYALSVKSMSSMAVTSGARAVGGLVGGGATAGVFGAVREKGRLTKEYWAYLGEKEAGVQTVAGSKKREWFDKLDITRRKSTDVVTALREKLYNADGSVKTNLTDDEVRSTFGELADAKARWALSSRKEKRVALIEIGGLGGQERNRTEFVRTIDKVDKDLGGYVAGHADVKARLMGGQEYDAFLSGLTTTQTQILDKGKATFDALQQDSAQRLALTQVAGYSPEVKKLRHSIALLWGERNKSVGTASGLEAALKEFNRQANEEAIKRGVYTGAIGMGIGALTQEAIMDWKFAQVNGWQGFGGLGHGGVATAIKELVGWGDGNSALVPHPILTGDHFIQHSQNLHIDTQGNMDLVKPDGAILHDNAIPAKEISFNPDGTFSQHTTDYLSQHGFASAADALHPVHDAGTHDLFFGQDKVTVSNDLHWIDNGDGTNRLVLEIQDKSGNHFEQVIHAHSVLNQGSPNDLPDVIKDMHNNPFVEFTPGHETVGAALPTHDLHVPGIRDVIDTAGGHHPVMAAIPDGTHLDAASNGTGLDLLDANNQTLLHNVQFDSVGHLDNTGADLARLKAEAAANHITWNDLHKTITVPGGGDMGGFDKIVGEMGEEKGWHGPWGWLEDPINANSSLTHHVPGTNLAKNLFRGYEENVVSSNNFHAANGSPVWDAVNHKVNYNAMQAGDVFKDLPKVLFGDEQLVKVGGIMDKAIAMHDANAHIYDHVASNTDPNYIYKIAYEIGRIGRVATKNEVLFFEKFLGGDQSSSLTLHQMEFIQRAIESGPPAIDIAGEVPNNIIIAPLTEVPQIPIPVIPILRRRGLEPGIAPNKLFNVDMEYYYSGATPAEALKTMETRRSNTLKENPQAELDDYKEVQTYLNQLDRDYRNKLEKMAKSVGPMKDSTKIVIAIPAASHQEGKNIYNSLKNYTYQTANKADYEIVVFANRPDVDKAGKPIAPDNTMSEIQRFMIDFPDMPVRVIEHVFPKDQALIGNIRKYAADLTLLRHHARGPREGSLIIVSNDADNKGISPEYVDNFLQKFESNSKVDGYLGQIDWDPEVYTKSPLVHVGTRLFQYIEIFGRRSSGKMPSSGANFAFRSNIYAAVGGYLNNASIAEDVLLGRSIMEARGNQSGTIKFAGAKQSRVYTSARRALDTLKDGLAPVEQWNRGFSAFDDDIRKMDMELPPDIDYQNPEHRQEFLTRLERIVNRTVDMYDSSKQLGKDHELYRKIMNKLGMKYEVVDDKIQITDASVLITGLEAYRENAKQLLDLKSGRISK